MMNKISDFQSHSRRRDRLIALICAGVFFSMIALTYASVPLYSLFCQVTGFAGTPGIVKSPEFSVRADGPALNGRMIEVRFDANVARGMPWIFTPRERSVKVEFDEVKLVFYQARNKSDRPVSGTAMFNVTPLWLGQYFNKVDCFCFSEQRLEPGETVDMPVTFFVDSALLQEKAMKYLPTITLSYTFFPVDEGNPLALAPPLANGKGRLAFLEELPLSKWWGWGMLTKELING